MTDDRQALSDFYDKRQSSYQKDAGEEDFFLGMNRTLQKREAALYQDYSIDHPLIFVFGAPRSGTTLLSQLVAHSLNAGFVNNLSARFWLAPLHGIRLSQAILGDRCQTAFQSNYARTAELSDIHEFGYFWRHWLNKEHLDDVTFAAEREASIPWQQLRSVLANMQNAFARPMVFKNIFGAYHLRKMREVLGKVIYLFIERNPVDTAISILDARMKYYGDPSVWWSYTPVEYELIKDWAPMRQIAGQVYFLQRYYRREIAAHCPDISLCVTYRSLTENPVGLLSRLNDISRDIHAYSLSVSQPPPESFPFRTYDQRTAERGEFGEIFDQLEKQYP